MNANPFSALDAIFGLRHLLVSDDEETRIGDYTFAAGDVLGTAVRALCELGEYRVAYEVAIRFVLGTRTPRETHALIDEYFTVINNEWEPEEIDELTRQDLEEELARVMGTGVAIERAVFRASERNAACPSCGCKPGDGLTAGCTDALGCGYWVSVKGGQ